MLRDGLVRCRLVFLNKTWNKFYNDNNNKKTESTEWLYNYQVWLYLFFEPYQFLIVDFLFIMGFN